MSRVKQYALPNGRVCQHVELDDVAELARRMGPRARLQIKATGSKDGPLQVVYWPEDREVFRATVRESERKHLGQVLHQLLEQVGHYDSPAQVVTALAVVPEDDEDLQPARFRSVADDLDEEDDMEEEEEDDDDDEEDGN